MSKKCSRLEAKRQQLENEAIAGLMKCVAGYRSEEVKSTFEIDPEGLRRLKSEVVTEKTVAPELTAIIFTLTNLNPAAWKSKPEGGLITEVPEERVDLRSLSEAALKELAGYLEKNK